jgi:hypothetical protein
MGTKNRKAVDGRVTIEIGGRQVWIRAWRL